MKIGISFDPYANTYARYGKNKFLIIKQYGYAAADYNISDTNSELYSLSYLELKRKLLLSRVATTKLRF